jgi:hypothetical protein
MLVKTACQGHVLARLPVLLRPLQKSRKVNIRLSWFKHITTTLTYHHHFDQIPSPLDQNKKGG